MRKTIIAGNWKMNKTVPESITLATALKRHLLDVKDVDVVICPVYTALVDVYEIIEPTNLGLGAQDAYWEDMGAFTGEVSVSMLKDIGVKYVILGHSERRQFFSETNATVNKKTRAVLKWGLTPIVCIGENLAERESNKTFEVIRSQFEGSLAGLSAVDIVRLVIAYEPVWAIGTGKTATPAQAQEVHKFIRGLLAKQYDADVAEDVRLQYGGSVKPENIAELIQQQDIDGALVGGASLKEETFIEIVKNCCGIRK